MSQRTQRASRWGAHTSRIGRKKWTRLNLQNTMSSTDSTVIGAMNCFSKKNVFHIHTTCVPNSIHRMALVCLQLSRLLLPPRSVFQSGVLYIARPSFEPSRQEASRGPKMRGNSHVLPSWLLWPCTCTSCTSCLSWVRSWCPGRTTSRPSWGQRTCRSCQSGRTLGRAEGCRVGGLQRREEQKKKG